MPATTIVLVVEDEMLIAGMVCDALTDEGFKVVCAGNAAEALELIAAPSTIDALVTDINMGAGANDGWHVARCARNASPRLPVVYTTGGAANEFAAHGVGGSVLIVKPYAAGR